MIVSVPSKTFLLGEYGVLTGGPGLLINTSPRFTMKTASGNSKTSDLAFSEKSPAGKLHKTFLDKISDLNIQFHDPHNASGGLGASSAQFALLYSLIHSPKMNYESWKTEDFQELLKTYREISVQTHGRNPSGYDVISQVLGKVALVDSSLDVYESLDWGFDDLGFILLRTGEKVPTHTHLSELKEVNYSELTDIASEAVESYISKDSESFLGEVQAFAGELWDLGLVAPHTEKILNDFENIPKILASKGCGALGADTVLVFCRPSDLSEVRGQISKKYEVIGTHRDLAPGLNYEV